MSRITTLLEQLRDPRIFRAFVETDFRLALDGRALTLRAELAGLVSLETLVAEASAAGLSLTIHSGVPEGTLARVDSVFRGWYASDLAAGGAVVVRAGEQLVGIAGFGTRPRPRPWIAPLAPGEGAIGPLLGVGQQGGLGMRLALLAALIALERAGMTAAFLHGLSSKAVTAAYLQLLGGKVVADYDLAARVRKRRAVLVTSSCADYVADVCEESAAGRLPIDVAAIVSFAPDVYLEEYVAERTVPMDVRPWDRRGESRETFANALGDVIAPYEPEIVALLGCEYVMPPSFLARFPELVNLHGAYLPLDPTADRLIDPDGAEMPALRGMRAAEQAFDAKLRWAGATLHRVTAELDRGEVLVRTPTRIDFATVPMDAIVSVARAGLASASEGLYRWATELSA